MLIIPNVLWAGRRPEDYDVHVLNENNVLLGLERIGEVFVSIFALFCGVGFGDVSLIVIIAFFLMALYEIYWIRYFRSGRRMSDMYCDMFVIPVPGATLPVLAFQ